MTRLLVFPHSHFCEKARWALDHHGVAHTPVAILPGIHMITVRRYGPGTSVPVLIDGGDAIQGSDRILDHLERQHPATALLPEDPEARAQCLALEREMERDIGVTLRSILYHRLLAYPDFIRYCFTYPLPRARQLAFTLMYPALRRKIHEVYVGSDAAVAAARERFDAAMTRLSARVGESPYLVGDRFSRADLSVAAMLSLLVMPPEHPMPWPAIPDPEIRALVDAYASHPVSAWVREQYRTHRHRAPAAAARPA